MAQKKNNNATRRTSSSKRQPQKSRVQTDRPLAPKGGKMAPHDSFAESFSKRREEYQKNSARLFVAFLDEKV